MKTGHEGSRHTQNEQTNTRWRGYKQFRRSSPSKIVTQEEKTEERRTQMSRELINKPLIMEESRYLEDMDVSFQKTEPVTGQGSNVFKGIGESVAEMKQEPESIKDGIEHKEEEKPSIIRRKRAPKNKFKSDRLICESKSLLIKNAMHEEASDEDKAWLASLSDAEVDLLISIKQMAMERAKTIQDERVNGLFRFKVLRTIGILLKELIKERLKSVNFLGKDHETENILLGKHESHVSLGGGESNHILDQDIVEAALQETMVGEKKAVEKACTS